MIESNAAFAYFQVTVGATAVSVPSESGGRTAVRAIVSLETAQIRYRYDGGAPTADAGHLMDVGDKLVIEGALNLQQLKAIRTGSTSGVLSVTLEGA